MCGERKNGVYEDHCYGSSDYPVTMSGFMRTGTSCHEIHRINQGLSTKYFVPLSRQVDLQRTNSERFVLAVKYGPAISRSSEMYFRKVCWKNGLLEVKYSKDVDRVFFVALTPEEKITTAKAAAFMHLDAKKLKGILADNGFSTERQMINFFQFFKFLNSRSV